MTQIAEIVDGYVARAQIAAAAGGATQEQWLLNELGRETARQAQTVDGPVASLAPQAAASEGITDTFRELGGRVLARLERELHGLLCGTDPRDVADRETLGLSQMTVSAALATALTAGLGVGPQVAAIAAAIIISRLAAPALDEVCRYWAEHL